MKILSAVSGFTKRGRYVAFFSEGDDEELIKKMFEFLMTEVHEISAQEGLATITYNRDSNDKFAKYLVKRQYIGGRTVFMGKFIGPIHHEISLKNYKTQDLMYFDPRDF